MESTVSIISDLFFTSTVCVYFSFQMNNVRSSCKQRNMIACHKLHDKCHLSQFTWTYPCHLSLILGDSTSATSIAFNDCKYHHNMTRVKLKLFLIFPKSFIFSAKQDTTVTQTDWNDIIQPVCQPNRMMDVEVTAKPNVSLPLSNIFVIIRLQVPATKGRSSPCSGIGPHH